ncbi:hypothetical protein ACHAQJ_007471 [Trichoderma viride]
MITLTLPSPFLQLTPFLLLLLLYRLCPQHFPPSSTTTKLFILYALVTQLIIHRTSIFQSNVLLALVHLLIAAVYALRHLGKAAHRAQNLVLVLYAKTSACPDDDDLETNASCLIGDSSACSTDATFETNSSCSTYTISDPSSLFSPSEQLIIYTPQPDETGQILQDSPSPILSFFGKSSSLLQTLVRLGVLGMYYLRLSLFHTLESLYGQATWFLHHTSICFILFIKHIVQPFVRTSFYLVSLGIHYPPAIAIFTLHFMFWAVLLSMGEMYLLWACLLLIFWMLSWLDRT